MIPVVKISSEDIISKREQTKMMKNIDLAKQQFVALKHRLVLRYPFYASFLMGGGVKEVRFSNICKTAGVDAKNRMYINPNFFISLNRDEQLFLIGHEIWHLIGNHPQRKFTRKHGLWNKATDWWINSTLINDNFGKFITGGLYREGSHKMTVDALYQIALQEYEDTKQPPPPPPGDDPDDGNQPGDESNDEPGDEPGDDGDQPGKGDNPTDEPGDGGSGSGDDGQPGDNDGKGNGSGNGDDEDSDSDSGSGDAANDENVSQLPTLVGGDIDDGQDVTTTAVSKEPDYADTVGDDGYGDEWIPCDDGEPTADEIRDIQCDVQIAVMSAATAAKNRGLLPASVQQIVAEITESRIKWYDRLEPYFKNLAKNATNWVKRNRRIRNFYLPTMTKGVDMGVVVLQVDISGSIGKREVDEFNGHIVRFIEDTPPSELHILYTDTQVVHHEHFTRETLDEFKIKHLSGGGTWMESGFKFCDAQGIEPDLFITLTDGCDSYDIKNKPDTGDVVWVFTQRSPAPPYGETIYAVNM